MQRRVPCVFMRGGTSRGAMFLRDDLPEDDLEVDRLLVAAMGSPHPLQVDGMGGGHSLTSKVAIVSRSALPDVDVDYLFVQVQVDAPTTDRRPNCGNMLAAVGPYAIEAGLVEAVDGETVVRIRNVNTDTRVRAVIQTPGGTVTYEGSTVIDGVPGTGSPIRLGFAGGVGSQTGRLLPDGDTRTPIDGIPVTLIDGAMPMMLARGADFGLTGAETAEEIDADKALLARIEMCRILSGHRMGLGDVSGMVVPKVALLFPPRGRGNLAVRYLTPHECHRSLAVTGAVTLASSVLLAGAVTNDFLPCPEAGVTTLHLSFEHPSGQLPVVAEDIHWREGQRRVGRTSILRTARRLFEGSIIVPWPDGVVRAERIPSPVLSVSAP